MQTTTLTTIVEPPAAHTRRAPIEEVRAMVKAKKVEMQAEAEAATTRRRVANEIAAAYRAVSSRPVPEPYTEALKGRLPEVWYSDGGCPETYTLALGEIVSRRADGTPVRLPEGDDAPQPYTLALEARRQPTQKHNDH